MEQRPLWWAGIALAMMIGLYTGLVMPQPPKQAQEEAAPVFAAENIFEAPADDGFSIEVVRVDAAQRKRVLIYHTHTYEAFTQVDDDELPF